MPGIEKVMNGLEHCLSRYIDGLCDDCPYMGAIDKTYMIPMKCKEIIMRDALELLKSQQAEIERMKGEGKSPTWKKGKAFCGNVAVALKTKKYSAPTMFKV